jgi:hypothetical protein
MQLAGVVEHPSTYPRPDRHLTGVQARAYDTQKGRMEACVVLNAETLFKYSHYGVLYIGSQLVVPSFNVG